MQIDDIYRTDVPTCTPDTTLDKVATAMRDADTGIAAVLDGGRFVGVISERDLVRAMAGEDDPLGARVGDHATTNVITAHLGDELLAVAQRMVEHNIRHLPVVDSETELVGVVSMRDVFAVETFLGGISDDS